VHGHSGTHLWSRTRDHVGVSGAWSWVQLRFVNDLENLKLIMNCLKDSSKSIQFEAFHVFKVFVVVNRDKSQGVMDVLRHNRDKLLKYMSNFQSERGTLPSPHLPTFPRRGAGKGFA